MATPLRSPRPSPHVSPVNSPHHTPPVTSPRLHPPKVTTTTTKKSDEFSICGMIRRCVNGHICGRVSVLHVSVLCIIIGVILLVIGLVQLAPGAGEQNTFKYLPGEPKKSSK